MLSREYEEIKRVVSWELYPYWLAFIMPEVLWTVLEENRNHPSSPL